MFMNKTISYPKSSKGFSLAEVILTLTIVGTIAAFTIPTLINSSEQAQYNAGANTAFLMLSQALDTIASSGTVHAGTNTGNTMAGNNVFRNDFCNVMRCTAIGTDASLFTGPYYYYKSSTQGTVIDNYPAAILSNGMYLMQFESSSSCTGLNGIACAWIHVDINGAAGPNMNGEDLYLFYVVQNSTTGDYSILPAGSPQDPTDGPGMPTYSCAVGNWADGCAYQRIYYPNNMP